MIKDINAFQKKLTKYERAFSKAESNLVGLSSELQAYFDEEISVSPSTDGALITNWSGEIEAVQTFINRIKKSK